MTSNNALVPDPDKEDILASVRRLSSPLRVESFPRLTLLLSSPQKPFDWPWLYLGLRMNGWGAEMAKFYLIGESTRLFLVAIQELD